MPYNFVADNSHTNKLCSRLSVGGLTAQIGWFGLRVDGHPALNLHSSNKPGELSH